MQAKTHLNALLAACIAACTAGYALADPQQDVMIGDHAVNPSRILFKAVDANPDLASMASQIKGILGADVTIEYHGHVGIGVAELPKPTDAKTLKALIEELSADPGIAYAEPDYIVSIDTDDNGVLISPNDPSYPDLWGMRKIDAEIAWDTTTDSNGIVVGVIDTGVDYTHVDLSDNIWTNPGEIPGNGIDDDGNGHVDDIHGLDCINDDSDPIDDHNHGTHCAGTIGGVGNNGVGVAGVNWRTEIMALKFLSAGGSGSSSDAVECLNYAVDMKRRGVDVRLTSNSWGGGGASQAMEDAIEASGDEDMLFVAAAGNDGRNTDLSPSYPAGYNVPNIVAVAATTESDGLASFSNYGAVSVDLGAPGSNILSTTRGNSYDSYEGTSMATPHVAGALALLWGENTAASGLAMKSLIMDTVDIVPALSGRVVTNGRLNVGTAVGCVPGNPTLSVSLPQDFELEIGQTRVLTASISDCGAVTGATGEVSFDNGDPTVALRDDGVAPDQAADDGILSGTWIPANVGEVTADFALALGGETYHGVVTGDVVEFMGYYYDDQADYAWEDITQDGTPLSLSDDSSASVASPFPVQFFGAAYDSIRIGSNGYISFSDQSLSYVNAAIPSSSYEAFAAPFWDDLNPSSGGTVLWAVRGSAPNRRLIVQYEGLPHYPTYGAVSFQIIFHESSEDILVQYRDVAFDNAAYDNGASATVGMQRDGDYGQQYSYNSPVITDESAILWTRGSEEPGLPIPDITANGADDLIVVQPGEPILVEFSLDANGNRSEADQMVVAIHGAREYVRFERTGTLRDLPTRVALDRTLPRGAWLFVYGIDFVPDGEQSFDVYDVVPVWVKRNGATDEDVPDFDRLIKRWERRNR